MEDEHEEQALLGSTVRPSLFILSRDIGEYSHNPPVGVESSSDSDSWWGCSHSSCSSCSRSSESSEDWEEHVTEDGELLYIEPAELFPAQPINSRDVEQPVLPPVSKPVIDKQGRFVRWIRRRESKRQRPRLSLMPAVAPVPGVKLVTVQLLSMGKLDLTTLGLHLGEGAVVTGLAQNGPLPVDEVHVGDILYCVNNQQVTAETLDQHLAAISTPCQIVLGFQKAKESILKTDKAQSKRVERLLMGDPSAEVVLSSWPVCVMAVDMAEFETSADTADSQLRFCYPAQSNIAAVRGAFITLSHLLPSVVGSECRSCSCDVQGELVHIVFHKEDDLLLLVTVPDRICREEEAILFTIHLVRCLCFIYQTLQCCFRKERGVLIKLFSALFSRLVHAGQLRLDLPLLAAESEPYHFQHFLSAAKWIPLPREAQLQLDDALNELEACDLGNSEDCNTIEGDRLLIVLGSCLYHRGCLIASHLTKEDQLDVDSFLNIEGLLELNASEGVTRLVLWREVFPHSVNRGLPPAGPPVALPPPMGRWFLLVVSTESDMLAVLLENAGCCVSLPRQPRPHPTYVREAEDTLAHVQSLGLTSLAAQWLVSQARPCTTAAPHVQVPTQSIDKVWPPSKNLERPPDQQEDSHSQTTSNVSNPSYASESDENAPILGRRAERCGLSLASVPEPSDDSQSDSSDLDCDWSSFKGLSLNDNSSGLFDNSYLPSNVGHLQDITKAKITSGHDNILFHFVWLDGNEGVVVTPGTDPAPTALMARFTDAAHRIHAQLQHNVRFRATVNPRGVANKSLIAVKECGVLLDGGDDTNPHWVVGRLFFCPKPREVYVCYSDVAPQNMLELAFRLGLMIAG